MWFSQLWILVLPALCIGFRWDTAEFSASYFKGRNVPFVCVVSCGNVAWDVKFLKAASARSISVSSLDMDHLSYKSIKQCFRQLFTTVGVLMNAHCGDAEQILYIASEMRWLDLSHIWLIIDETTDSHVYTNSSIGDYNEDFQNSSRTLQTLSNLNVSVDADIILASRHDERYSFFDIFNFGKEQGGNMIVTEIGTWNPEEDNQDLVQQLNRCKFYRRWDFKQARMRIISVATSKDFDLKMLMNVNPVPGVVTISRTSTIPLMEVAELHNIKYVHTRTDKWLGTYEQNASRAVATSLYFREQDVTSVLRFAESLFARVTLINPALTSVESRYFYRIPTTGPGKFENQFLRPLSTGTWYCLLLVAILCTVIMLFATWLEARPSSFQYALFSVFASVCQQCFQEDAYDFTVRRISTARQITIFVTGIACVLTYNYYTSSVVSWLLNGPPPTINSLQELMESPLEVIFEDVGYTHSWLTVPGYYFNRRNAKYEDILKQRVLSKKRTTPLFMPIEQGVALVKEGGYAYHTESSNANNFISRTFDQSDLCELDSLPSMVKVLVYPGVQKDSPYKEFFTWSLTRMLERGIVSCIQRRTAPLQVACEGSSPRALALGGAAPAFILLAFGYLVAVVFMLLERFIFKMKQRFHQNYNSLGFIK